MCSTRFVKFYFNFKLSCFTQMYQSFVYVTKNGFADLLKIGIPLNTKEKYPQQPTKSILL